MVLLGQIGTGSWGIKLLKTINSLATVKSCYGQQNKDSIPRNVKIVHDVDEIVLDEELDGILIASPPESHYELAKKCLERGHNLFIEKPMCTDANEAQVLVELARANKLKLMVGFVYLYSNEYDRLKRDLHGIDNIEAYFMKSKPKPHTPCMLDLGSHFVALALDFYGHVATAVALKGDSEDAVVDIRFSTGTARIHASYKSEHQRREVSFMRDRKTIYRWNVISADYNIDNPLMNECERFVDYLQNDVAPKTDALLGLEVTKLVGGMLP
jgi:predicted dehydrogenase